MPRLLLIAVPLLSVAAAAQAPIGTVKTEGNRIAGLVTVSEGKATLNNGGSITAVSQNAEIALTRGGTVRVCAGSTVQLSQASAKVSKPPMLMALDRGAVEIKLPAEKNDTVMTPDLRMELSAAAPIDLRIRVVPNGDTCVDNAGKDGPMLHITEVFGTGAYFVRPGQHVLFEHGQLREVVDNETSNCGCPRGNESAIKGKPQTAAAQANPFPEAVSQGLQPTEVPQAPPGETHVQVAAALKYDGATNTATGPPETAVTAGTDAPAAAASAATSVSTTSVRPAVAATPTASTRAPKTEDEGSNSGGNPFRAIGHFFKRLFGGS